MVLGKGSPITLKHSILAFRTEGLAGAERVRRKLE